MPHAFLNALRPAKVPLSCTKTSFESRRKALRATGRMPKTGVHVAIGSGRINVYLCSVCLLWHVGHKPIRGRKEQ